ncbi:MAG TPA: MFS transporter [Candidatus Paenalcaligenes intestinipullorum]|uniref:MFS transporter n=1 Tax=Candidatus Paenalcaligenes intestinipullorum TaxID=2838718 RepID=A0A9D2RIN1_9BURK|nr:MFS transporter [Candidatus Paenalcaligenes intestinipullorum]
MAYAAANPPNRVLWINLLALLFLAGNLRAPITGFPPVLDQIQASYMLTSAQAGLLMTVPLVLLGSVSPLVPRMALTLGYGRTVGLGIGLIIVGVSLRLVPSASGLYLGTAVAAAGIAIGNVLLPSLVKRDFPQKIPLLTGFAAIAMGIGAALASATVVPLSHWWSWRWALFSVIWVAVMAALFHTLQQRQQRRLAQNQTAANRSAAQANTSAPKEKIAAWRFSIAWQVTIFMGINSTLYYAVGAWLPTILAEQGIGAAEAGTVHGIMQFATAVPGLVMGAIIARFKDQVGIAMIMALSMGGSLLGLLWWPQWASFWMFIFGAACGGILITAFTFMGLRVVSIQQSAALSGMAQAVGYMFAALGPWLVGKIQGTWVQWDTILMAGAVLSILMAVCGGLAGRDRQIDMAA